MRVEFNVRQRLALQDIIAQNPLVRFVVDLLYNIERVEFELMPPSSIMAELQTVKISSLYRAMQNF
jgi:hypothetical protein